MTLGNRIKELRVQKLLSQEKIAEELGVSRQAVSKWETGLSNPDTENLMALAKLFGVSVEELIEAKREDGTKELPEENDSKQHRKNRKYQYIFAAVLIILLVVFGGTALLLGLLSNRKSVSVELDKENDPIPTITVTPLETATSENKVDYLNSPDSLQLQETAQGFAKAYFSGDLEGVKGYLADAQIAEVYENPIYENLEYLTLKWNPEDLADQTTIGVQYQFQEKGTDSATYLGLELMKLSDKWKVTSFYLEK